MEQDWDLPFAARSPRLMGGISRSRTTLGKAVQSARSFRSPQLRINPSKIDSTMAMGFANNHLGRTLNASDGTNSENADGLQGVAGEVKDTQRGVLAEKRQAIELGSGGCGGAGP